MYSPLLDFLTVLCVLSVTDMSEGQQVIVYEAGVSKWVVSAGVTTVSRATLGTGCSPGGTEDAESQAFVLSSSQDVIGLQFTGTAIAIYGATFASESCDKGTNPTFSSLDESGQHGSTGNSTSTSNSAPTTTRRPGNTFPRPGACVPYAVPQAACGVLLAQYTGLEGGDAYHISITTTGARLAIFNAQVIGLSDVLSAAVPSVAWPNPPDEESQSAASLGIGAAPAPRSPYGAGGSTGADTITLTATNRTISVASPGITRAPKPGNSAGAVAQPTRMETPIGTRAEAGAGTTRGSPGMMSKGPPRQSTAHPRPHGGMLIPAIVVPAVVLSASWLAVILYRARQRGRRRRTSLRPFNLAPAASPQRADSIARARKYAHLGGFWNERAPPPRYGA